MDVSLHFHGTDQFLDQAGRMRSKVYRGEVIQYLIKYEDIELLEKPNIKNIVDETCSHNSYDACLYRKVNEYMRASTNDNCTAPWISTNENVCTSLDDITESYRIWKNTVENDVGVCPIPCHFVSVNVDAKDSHETAETNTNLAISTFYFPSAITKSTEHEIYDLLRVFGEIGGYISLLLGYSALGSALGIVSWINCKIESLFWHFC